MCWYYKTDPLDNVLNTIHLYLILQVRAWQDLCSYIRGWAILQAYVGPHRHNISGLHDLASVSLSPWAPLRNHLWELHYSTMRQHMAWRSISQLTPIWCYCMWKQLIRYLWEEIKFVALILSHVVIFLSLFARESQTGTSQWLVYLYNTLGILDQVFRDSQSITTVPLNTLDPTKKLYYHNNWPLPRTYTPKNIEDLSHF